MCFGFGGSTGGVSTGGDDARPYDGEHWPNVVCNEPFLFMMGISCWPANTTVFSIWSTPGQRHTGCIQAWF